MRIMAWDAPEDFWRRTWRCLSSSVAKGNGSDVFSRKMSLSCPPLGGCLFYLFCSGASIAETSTPSFQSPKSFGWDFCGPDSCHRARLLPDERNLEPDGYCWGFLSVF
ncbi:hypothetical protein AVEN_71555-1 [Araneus ventricosus]|uniref:Uncharacterized protein n=1 Tax=Araneus ventricosus TaxID=182803 RepID=A0A4Y2EVH9_ARAVE|nr:hypothetical protein AVEN_71555-1 [Araneus ventricosus]